MVMQSFTVPGTLPGLNQIVQANRDIRYTGANQKKEQDRFVRLCIAAAKLVKMAAPVKVSITWYEKDRRRDADNIMAGQKFIIDALVEKDIIGNDGQSWIPDCPVHHLEIDAKNPRVEVVIEGEPRG